ncbi:MULTISPECIES: hypothetical protein [Arthrobacter]|nr:hypothetical protein [Arthrobacter sp. lap29]
MNTGFPIYGALSSQSWAESAGIEAAADARHYLVPLKVPLLTGEGCAEGY